jgi:DNA-binding PadR family transcriptional regulator
MPPAHHDHHPGPERALLDYIALGLLADGPGHGYGLYEDFTATFAPAWGAGRSKFYATLADLHGAGLLGATTEPQENRPPRKVYHLTAAGQDALIGWLYRPVAHPRDVRVVIPVKLRLLDLLSLPGLDRLLDAQIGLLEERLEREAHHDGDSDDPADDLFLDIITAFRRSQLTAMIGWLTYCKARYTERMQP